MRHHDVGQYSTSIVPLYCSAKRDRVAAIGGFQHRVTEALQELADHPAQIGLIFRNQNRFLAGARGSAGAQDGLPPSELPQPAGKRREGSIPSPVHWSIARDRRCRAQCCTRPTVPGRCLHLALGGKERLEDLLWVSASMPMPVSETASMT